MAPPTSLPPSVDLRLAPYGQAAGVIQSQPGDTCIVVSMSNAIWCTQNKQAGSLVARPSARFMAYLTIKNLGSVAKAIKTNGVCSCEWWDWLHNPDGSYALNENGQPLDEFATPPPPVIAEAKRHPCITKQVQRKLSAMKQSLVDGYAFAFDGGPHEQCVIAYDDTLNGGSFITTDSLGGGRYNTYDYDDFLGFSQECFAVLSVG